MQIKIQKIPKYQKKRGYKHEDRKAKRSYLTKQPLDNPLNDKKATCANAEWFVPSWNLSSNHPLRKFRRNRNMKNLKLRNI